MQKHYFKSDKVDSIIISMESESYYKWFDSIESMPKKFLGIKYGMMDYIQSGWSVHSSENRVQSSYIEKFKCYRIDEINKKVFNRTSVDIKLCDDVVITSIFDTNEEAQIYVDGLVSSSNKEFCVILN
jgi:hypothetical protein